MGKLVQVKSSIASVQLPPLGIYYTSGELVTLTDSEYSHLTTGAKNSIVVLASDLPDPVRTVTSNTVPSSIADAYRLAIRYTDAAIRQSGSSGPADHTYTDTAVAGEATRAAAAENGKLAKASNLSDLSNAAAARTALGLGSAATQASSAFDTSGAATSALGTAQTYTNAETTRATAAENAKLAKASNLSDLNDAAAARTNLGLGSSATHAATDFDTVSARDSAIATETTARTAADAATLASANSYTDSHSGGGGVYAEQLDYAYDLSGVATIIPTDGTQIDIAGGLGISCPATGTGRTLQIRCGGSAQITVAGAGLLGLNIYETTTGTSVQIGTSAICGSFTVGSGSAFPTFPTVTYDLGPTTIERTFILRASMIRDGSSTLAAKVRSSATGIVRAYIEGVAM